LALKPISKRKLATMKRSSPEDLSLLESFCPDTSLLKEMKRRLKADDPMRGQCAYPQWVDFILTTANSWQRPIEDFTLIIERPQPSNENLISFCSPGIVEKIDADHFQVHLTNFIPTSELHIGFFKVPLAKSAANND
ncbi:MAG: DUF4424 family protein, partial [Syntrophobacteraceae bacterium]